MNEVKSKQKSTSKPVISSKLPKAFFHSTSEKTEAKSPIKSGSKQTIKLSKVLKHLDKMPDQTTEKLFEPYSKLSETVSKLPYFPVHLEEMITLTQTSSTSMSSTVRKVIHAKSLTLFSIKQIPISTRNDRNTLRDWIEKWQTFKNPGFIKVIESFWNIPEGCVSIVSEFSNAGSLNDLCKVIGSIPELPLAQIARALLETAAFMNEQNEHFIGLSTTQVLFTRDGGIKIGPGISKRLQKSEGKSDLFYIGQVLLKAISDEVGEIKGKKCCLLHSYEMNPILAKTSEALQGFLCMITSFSFVPSASEALQHAWLKQEEYKGAEVTLQEIINVGFKGEEYWEAGDIQLNRICEALKVVLVGRKFARPSMGTIEDLAEEIGVPKEVLKERLNKVYNEISN